MRWRSILLASWLMAMSACGQVSKPNPDGGGDGGGADQGASAGDQLLAVTPSVARAGDTVTLEGTFSTGSTVTFPGGATAGVALLGPHRATVVVPTSATAGDLTLTGGGATATVRFWRAPFDLALQTFRPGYEQASYARLQTTLTAPRRYLCTATADGFVHAIGGYDNSRSLTTVERALINADGTLGAFAGEGTALVTARQGATAHVIGGSVYVVGGKNESSTLASVERAAINADGTLGTFADAGVSLKTPRSFHASVVIGSWLYVFGGQNGSNLSSSERAPIAADGTLGAFETVDTASLNVARRGHSVTVWNGWLYVVGGYADGGAPLASVERALINGDGSLGPFGLLSTMLMPPVAQHAAIATSGVLYVIGGAGSGGPVSTVLRADLASDGTLGPFSAAGGVGLSDVRADHALAQAGPWLFVLGGSGAGGALLSSVEHSSLNQSGALGTFTSMDLALPGGGKSAASVVVLGNHAYVIGGGGNNLDVQLEPDGSVHAIVDTGKAPIASRYGSCAVVLKDQVVLVGGGATLNTLESAPISADGTLGAFTTLTTPTLNQGRVYPTCLMSRDRLYVFGGASGTPPYLDEIEHSDLTAGNLGAFVVETVKLSVPRANPTGLFDGSLYVFGGYNNSTGAQSSIDRFTLSAANNLMAPVSGGALPVGLNGQSSLSVGHFYYTLGGSPGGSNSVDSIYRFTINYDQSITGNGAAGTLVNARYYGAAVAAGNWAYVFGGQNAATASAYEIAPLK